jgi:hypothetical protein
MLKKYIKVLEQRLNEAEFTAYEQEAWIAELEEQLRRSTDSGHDGTESQRDGEREGEGPVRQEVRALREEVARRGMHRADSPAVDGAAPSPPVVASLSQEEAETMYSAGLEMEVQTQKTALQLVEQRQMTAELERQVR